MISRVSVALLVIALLALAGLQYHWIGQISVAERQRLEQSVRDSSNRFAADFAGEIRSLTNALDIRGVGEPEVSTIVARAHGWAEAAAYPDLLKTMYLVRPASSGEFHLSQVNVQNSSLVPVQWPAKWTALQALLQRDPFVVERRPNGNSNIELPKAEGTPTVLIQYGGGRPPDPQRGRGGQGFGRGQGRGGPQEFRRGPPPQRAPEPPPRGNPPSRQGQGPGEPPPPPPPRGGRAAEPPPQRAPEPPPQDRPQPAQALQPAPPAAWLLVELDDTAFTKQIFPALFARDFPMTEDQDYRIAVVSATPQQIIFSTGNAWTTEDLASPDYSMDLIGFGPGGPRGNPGNPGNFFGAGQRGGAPQPAFYIGQPLRLLAKHEAGSLEIAVSNLRRRNLAVSFGILLVLGLGAGVVIISGQRARTLGKLQMEFAAAVSHELRTPLAVIQSAAHNLRSGVVKDREGIEEYATIVQKEARRLSTMVEQVMTYAETQSGRKRYDIAPVDLNEVVDRALQHLAIPLGDAKATVENRMDPALPPAMADEVAMTQCVQNLLSNAVKYGSSKDSVQIEIESEVDRAAGTIRIHVIDHGAGVPSVDEKHLFDPFHRGENAATNTPGNGLGLHLVQRIMESQKGTVSYKRAPHGGACFTLTLPLGNDGMKL